MDQYTSATCPAPAHWVNTYYVLGTPIGITEYNWGAESNINGATAQAEILGIFGREGLDFGHAMDDTRSFHANFLKRSRCIANYSGAKSVFGEAGL